MKTIHEVSNLTGLSIRALRYYDSIGLLRPATHTEAGYRLYDDADLERLQQILLFRELEFPLKDIKRIVDSPDFDQARALEQQIELLKLKREHITNLIDLAEGLQNMGNGNLDFDAFDKSKIDEYAKQAKASWGDTPQWSEYETKSSGRTADDDKNLGHAMMELFIPFGTMAAQGADPASPEATAQAKLIQDFISEHYYTCTDEIFAQLGQTYGCGGEFTDNINAVAGEGAAQFASQAIAALLA